jgi:probable F420-dependent oxidoreductase
MLKTGEAYRCVARAAEALGYDFLSVSDHVIVPREQNSPYPYSEDASWAGGGSGFCFEAMTAMTFLVACTERIKVLSSVAVVPQRPAVLTAKVLSSMDVLSNGRVLFGVGTGWLREEFDIMETPPFQDRGQVTDEFIEAMKRLWSQEDPQYSGDFVEFSNVLFSPKPPDGRIPIWVGGESNIALRRTVRLGDVWFPGNNNPKWRVDTPERLKVRINRLHQFAEAEQRDPASIGLAYVWFHPVSYEPVPGFDTHRRMFSGSPDDIAADVAALKEAGVADTSIGFAARDASELTEAMQRFSADVMPLL